MNPAPATVPPYRLAIRDAGSVAVGIGSFGVVLGVTMSVLDFGTLPGLVGAVAVYGGSAQLTAVTLVQQGATLLAIVGSAAVVNARLLLYGAGLCGRFRGQPAWFSWLGPQFLIDQTYLLATARSDLDQRAFRRYWVWLGCSVLLVWTCSIAVGLTVGPVLLLAAVCWLFRITFVTLLPAERLPTGLRDGLEYLAPAVLAAIIGVEVVSMIGRATPGQALSLVPAVVVTGVVAYLTRSLSIVCAVGLGLVLFLDLVL